MRGDMFEMTEGPEPVDRPIGGACHKKPASAGNIQPGDISQRIYRCRVPTKSREADDTETNKIRIDSGTRQQGDNGIKAVDKGFGKAAMHGRELSALRRFNKGPGLHACPAK